MFSQDSKSLISTHGWDSLSSPGVFYLRLVSGKLATKLQTVVRVHHKTSTHVPVSTIHSYGDGGKTSMHKAAGLVWVEHGQKFVYLHSPGALQDPCLLLQPCLQIAEKETEIDRDREGQIVTVTAVCYVLSAISLASESSLTVLGKTSYDVISPWGQEKKKRMNEGRSEISHRGANPC